MYRNYEYFSDERNETEARGDRMRHHVDESAFDVLSGVHSGKQRRIRIWR